MISFDIARTVLVGLALVGLVVGWSPSLALAQHLSDNDLYQVIGGEARELGPGEEEAYYGSAQDGRLRWQEEPSNERLMRALADQLVAARQVQHPDDVASEALQGPVEKKESLGTERLIEPDEMPLAELNSHWPAFGLIGEDDESGQQLGAVQLSRPVNDPEEFEGRMGRLTDELNHSMPQTSLRQQLLMRILNHSLDNAVGDRDEPLPSLSSIKEAERSRLLNELGQLSADQVPLSSGAADDGEEQDKCSTSDPSSSASQDTPEESSTHYKGGSEYIDRPLELSGHQYVQGGAGEGRQLLGPDGTFENVQVVKTDSAIPSYCNPPNPCPIGYTAKDGCLEEFVNLASFSREYQAKQKCSCDNEHSLFNCASPPSSTAQGDNRQQQQPPLGTLTSRGAPESGELDEKGEEGAEEAEEEGESSSPYVATPDKLDTLARTIQNRFGDLASVQRLIGKQQQLQHVDGGDEGLSLAIGHDGENSDYLVRSARKLSSLDMHHKVNLD